MHEPEIEVPILVTPQALAIGIVPQDLRPEQGGRGREPIFLDSAQHGLADKYGIGREVTLLSWKRNFGFVPEMAGLCDKHVELWVCLKGLDRDLDEAPVDQVVGVERQRVLPPSGRNAEIAGGCKAQIPWRNDDSERSPCGFRPAAR